MNEITIPYPLSGYIAEYPIGGKWCQQLEAEWCDKFGVSHAIAMNSATSGLLAACMAIHVNENYEVIVSPWSMSATAAAPSVLRGMVVFADINPDTFTLDPESVASKITPNTKAVIVTNLFGQPAHLGELMALCTGAGLYLIEDNSQAILAKERNRYAGTIGHMGVFSLNVHKHIQTGEGGIVVTNSIELARNLRGAMNHGEARDGFPGLNLRMTEITAMMACKELDRVEYAVLEARNHAKAIKEMLNGSNNIWYYPAREGCTHSYYCLAIGAKPELHSRLQEIGCRRYLRPLYDLGCFKGPILPVMEEVWHHVFLIELCHNPQLERIIEDLKELK